jgi:hypothetical protein
MRLIGKRTRFAGALLVAAAAALPFLAAPAPAHAAMPLLLYFTWTDGGTGHAWDNVDNWNCPPMWPTSPCGLPDQTSENARFVAHSCEEWEVEHVDEEVGQILIEGSVELTGSSVTLQCESLIIDARSAGCDLTLEITGSNGEFIAVP